MKTTMKYAVAVSLLMSGAPAFAQDIALPETNAATPAKGDQQEIEIETGGEVDLSTMVLSAAKGVTTVQEAPAIITIFTADEIRNRGFRWLSDMLQTVPGWGMSSAIGNQVPFAPLVRGVGQSALLLRDGISMFDPFTNVPVWGQTIPMESIKRVELVSGPGGVLWGANSYMGIANVISKDAEDVNGLELSAGYGDGPGYKQNVRAYALFGKTFFGGKLKIFQHASYESYVGSSWGNLPQLAAAAPAPQPIGPAFYQPNNFTDAQRSWIAIIDGKWSFGPISLYYSIPFADMHQQLVFANNPAPGHNTTFFQRHVILEYKDRFWKDKFGLTLKGYWVQFIDQVYASLYPSWTGFQPYTNPNGTLNYGGVHFNFGAQNEALNQRAGLTLDTDLSFQKIGVRVLLGGEFFYEGVKNYFETFPSQTWGDLSNAPAGTPSTASPATLPLVCPYRQNGDGSFTPLANCARQFVNDQYRLVAAGYVDLQYKPTFLNNKVAVDGGVRIQYGFGGRGYGLQPLYSAAIVYNFLPNYHIKLNYTTGFRPPVFNNTDAVAGGILYAANPHLRNETSQAFQGELNARLLRNVRKVKELELRVDYSYTFLDQLITIRQGGYLNTGQRSIHSAEAFAKLYLQGDHFLSLSYTFLWAQASDVGVMRNTPNHWVSLGASFNLIKNMLDVNANLLVTGAYEDPDRIPGAQAAFPGTTTVARASDQAFDRLTPVALLQLGFRLRFLKEKLGISGQFYNVLNQRFYWPDPFYDVTPSVEMTPVPAAGFSFFAKASYHF